MTTTYKLYAPATKLGLKQRLKRSAIGGFCRQLTEFCRVYALYRRASHRPTYCAKIAWGIAVNKLPF